MFTGYPRVSQANPTVGDRNQVQFLTTLLRPLGCPVGNTDDKTGYRGSQTAQSHRYQIFMTHDIRSHILLRRYLLPPPFVLHLSFDILSNVQHPTQHPERNYDPHLFVPLNTLLGSDARKDRIGVPDERGGGNALKFLRCEVASSFGLVECLCGTGHDLETRKSENTSTNLAVWHLLKAAYPPHRQVFGHSGPPTPG